MFSCVFRNFKSIAGFAACLAAIFLVAGCDVSLEGDRVAFARPLWLDLGGIAKGYAVDRAIAVLIEHGSREACVNAGGDLRRVGREPELVHVRGASSWLPALELSSGSVASSGDERIENASTAGPHLDGRRRTRAIRGSRVSVVAERCAVADALTKIVLADPSFAETLLPRYEATALLHDPRGAWKVLGA